MHSIFLLVPSLHPTGPVKGAVALANALAGIREVTLVSLKEGPGPDAVLNPNVRQVCLANTGNGLCRIGAYRALLSKTGGRAKSASISFCLSADMTNLFCRGQAVTCASVRGNLPQNYRLDYGIIGVPFAVGHLVALRGVDRVVAMTTAMSRQVARYTGRQPIVIGNFVDEAALDGYRDTRENDGPFRFVFLASLTTRKRPEMLIDALENLLASRVEVRLDMLGEGPLKCDLMNLINNRGLTDTISLHGHLSDPYPILAQADAMVLPSLSEGVSRAGLEALHLGVPCVMRDTDGNAELIQNGVNGVLFRQDAELPAAMLAAARLGREIRGRMSLLPAGCRQQASAQRYLELVELT